MASCVVCTALHRHQYDARALKGIALMPQHEESQQELQYPVTPRLINYCPPSIKLYRLANSVTSRLCLYYNMGTLTTGTRFEVYWTEYDGMWTIRG